MYSTDSTNSYINFVSVFSYLHYLNLNLFHSNDHIDFITPNIHNSNNIAKCYSVYTNMHCTLKCISWTSWDVSDLHLHHCSNTNVNSYTMLLDMYHGNALKMKMNEWIINELFFSSMVFFKLSCEYLGIWIWW